MKLPRVGHSGQQVPESILIQAGHRRIPILASLPSQVRAVCFPAGNGSLGLLGRATTHTPILLLFLGTL